MQKYWTKSGERLNEKMTKFKYKVKDSRPTLISNRASRRGKRLLTERDRYLRTEAVSEEEDDESY